MNEYCMKKDTNSSHSLIVVLAITVKFGDHNLWALEKLKVFDNPLDKLDFPVPGHSMKVCTYSHTVNAGISRTLCIL